ncbi:rhamnosyltransferase [Marinomonas balearica]|uniref:Rhamnosyltransferase n=2 Tax=Marinomonas balearica TaxID=491947 RepID=A0A4R6M4M2_9GAMM|nr:rhamnosyltransferase [Marinomonas balearica]
MSLTVIIPTYNGGCLWKESAKAISTQLMNIDQIKVIDSSSKDDTREVAKSFGFDVYVIDQKDFDHGGTRSIALEGVATDLVVFLTQDALLNSNDAISKLIAIFDEADDIVCAYGRQLPHIDANPLAQHARYNSYKEQGYVTGLDDHFPMGFRKAFISNSFAAYRTDFLRSIGAFPKHLILGEDAYVAAKALSAGKRVAYVAESHVLHSHNYSTFEEFKRYFDIGVFHTTQSWMVKQLGGVEGEGVKFALDQIKYVIKQNKYPWVFKSIFASLAKYLGYKLGKKHKILGPKISRKLSMYKSYWNRV